MSAKSHPSVVTRNTRTAHRGKIDPQAMVANAQIAANFLKALANNQRLVILCTLIDGPKSVGEINEQVGLSQSALSQHLAVLREKGLVSTDKQSQTIYYSICDDKARRLLVALHECFCSDRIAGIVSCADTPDSTHRAIDETRQVPGSRR